MAEQQQRLHKLLLPPLPTGFNIIESGHYVYWLNGTAAKVVEPWCKAQNSQGQVLVHCARFADDYGITILVKHHTSPAAKGNNDFSTHISWQQQAQSDICAQYVYNAEQQQFSSNLTCDGQQLINSQQRVDKFLFFPLMRVFSGDIIQELTLQGPLLTVVPDIQTPQLRTSLLHPTESIRSAKKFGDEQIFIAGKQYDTSRYAYLSERYQSEDEAVFWLNSQGLLLKYCWQQSPAQHWQIELHNYQQFSPIDR
ncbi:hypothetical protein [Paraglaciecola hydrolytica]|uniref:Uncharacterized protein n=1 Tax=Paraglaciecola hydrolytica TaxID=1799789 RepID=A0A136A5B5_9ALTE|nr:hypothetical protein [Paraglaciecola hydrolytica]KXI30435.1 hypothetical protein AX660_10750 [Paraglaciecola hydrolytica]